MRRRADPSDLDLEARVARLTPGQRACLDLVDDHATSKEIALVLGISRHTVDARLRQAMQVLGVTSRREAAIIWRASGLARDSRPLAGAGMADGYQPFAYQPSRIEAGPLSSEDMGHEPAPDLSDLARGTADSFGHHGDARVPLSTGVEAADAIPEVADATAWTWRAPAGPAHALRLWGGANDLTLPQRLAGILIVTIVAMLAFGLLLSGIAALTQLHT